MASKLRIALHRVNVSKWICSTLIGKDHDFIHSAGLGFIIMTIGVVIAKHFGHSSDDIVAHLGDVIGYSLHGIGLVPFVEAVLKLGGE